MSAVVHTTQHYTESLSVLYNKLTISENKQRIDETVSQKQEELKRKPERSIQNGIPDTDPVLFHDSNEKEREITREDEGYVLSNDERLKEKYKFRGKIYLIH